MKNTMKINVESEKEYMEFVEMLLEHGFIQIGHRLFESKDFPQSSYIRIIRKDLI